MKILLLGIVNFVVVSHLGCSTTSDLSSGEEESKIDYRCTSSREFITTILYLRDHDEFKLSEQKNREIATEVAKGCTNAASRFASVVDMLTQVKLDSASAVRLGIEMSAKSDEVAHAFKNAFRAAYSKSGLDLNQAEALAVAKRFSIEFKGDPETAEEDFVNLVEYCVARSELNLPRPKCADLATRVAAYSERFDAGVSGPFVDLIGFMRDEDDGPRLSTGDAIVLAEKLISISPLAEENFREAFAFASDDGGLKLGRADAVKFASKIAGYSKSAAVPEKSKEGE